MNEEKSSVPFLTLDPNATAAAVQEAPAAEEAKEEVTEEVQAAKLELESLTPAEQAAVKEFSEKINVLNRRARLRAHAGPGRSRPYAGRSRHRTEGTQL